MSSGGRDSPSLAGFLPAHYWPRSTAYGNVMAPHPRVRSAPFAGSFAANPVRRVK